ITLMSINPTTGLPVVDVLGNPVLTPYVTGITGAEGLAFDPLTNDFFISTFGSGDQLVQITGFPTGGPILGPCARGNVGLSVGPPIDVLTVNGSTGGIGRRVDVPIGGAISVQVSPSSLSTVPSLFAIYGYIGQPGSAELTPVGSLGDFCFPPNDFIPEYPGTFVLTSSYFPGHPSALVPSTAAPWSTTDADGLPHRYLVTFQGVIDDPSASTGYAVTNAIIVAIL
ncbi:MAG: hypothetical protein KDB53_20360, partial [Planctomycetes bacterium]|nr:hypothetical protein [Planctomycetota bacterium]